MGRDTIATKVTDTIKAQTWDVLQITKTEFKCAVKEYTNTVGKAIPVLFTPMCAYILEDADGVFDLDTIKNTIRSKTVDVLDPDSIEEAKVLIEYEEPYEDGVVGNACKCEDLEGCKLSSETLEDITLKMCSLYPLSVETSM